MMAAVDDNEMRRYVPFPFPRGRFPRELGAVVQRTVLDGVEPAREITHSADGSWMVGDGVNDPNEPGAATATHLWHVLDQDPSIAWAARLSPGQVATRDGKGEPWVIEKHVWPD